MFGIFASFIGLVSFSAWLLNVGNSALSFWCAETCMVEYGGVSQYYVLPYVLTPFCRHSPNMFLTKELSISCCPWVWGKIYLILIFIIRLSNHLFYDYLLSILCWFSWAWFFRVRPSLVLKAMDCTHNSDGLMRWSIYKSCIDEFHGPGYSPLPTHLSLNGSPLDNSGTIIGFAEISSVCTKD